MISVKYCIVMSSVSDLIRSKIMSDLPQVWWNLWSGREENIQLSYHRNIQERQFLPMFWFNWAVVTFTEGAFKYMNLMEVKTSRQCEKNWIPASSPNYSRKIYSWQSQFCNSCHHRQKFKKVCWRLLSHMRREGREELLTSNKYVHKKMRVLVYWSISSPLSPATRW